LIATISGKGIDIVLEDPVAGRRREGYRIATDGRLRSIPCSERRHVWETRPGGWGTWGELAVDDRLPLRPAGGCQIMWSRTVLTWPQSRWVGDRWRTFDTRSHHLVTANVTYSQSRRPR